MALYWSLPRDCQNARCVDVASYLDDGDIGSLRALRDRVPASYWLKLWGALREAGRDSGVHPDAASYIQQVAQELQP